MVEIPMGTNSAPLNIILF